MNPDEQAIRSLVARWHQATAAGDIDAVLALMAEDVVFLVPGQAPLEGKAQFERGLRGLLDAHRVHASAQVREVQVAGDLAYCWTVLSVRVTANDGVAPMHRSGSALSIFRRQPDGAWVLFRDANLLSAGP